MALATAASCSLAGLILAPGESLLYHGLASTVGPADGLCSARHIHPQHQDWESSFSSVLVLDVAIDIKNTQKAIIPLLRLGFWPMVWGGQLDNCQDTTTPTSSTSGIWGPSCSIQLDYAPMATTLGSWHRGEGKERPLWRLDGIGACPSGWVLVVVVMVWQLQSLSAMD